MNPYGDTDQNSRPNDDAASLPCSALSLNTNTNNPSFSNSLCPPVIQTGHTSVRVLSHTSSPCQYLSEQGGGRGLVPSDSEPTPPLAPTTLAPCQVSVLVLQSPELHQSPLPLQLSEDTSPDLECSICFSEFNNVFRCPKMLQCKHTFCLECLARMNIKSSEPSTIQCPLCRNPTPLPTLGLPTLPTDSHVLSYLPAAMQRVYSIRFLRSKGKLKVKRSSQSHQQRGLRIQRSANHSLHVGLPSQPVEGQRGAGDMGGALFRLTGRPACRAFLLTSVVMMMVLLTVIVIFLLTFKKVVQ